MLKVTCLVEKLCFPVFALVLILVVLPQSVQAQPLQGMSCNDLWYERNQIFAQNGYCFKTQRGQMAFGRGCFPPYGRLNFAEQRRVDRIKRQEQRMGCLSSGQIAPPPISNYSGMSCGDLWHERNAIFASKGHCFKTARGRAAFGPNCFPPYGKLGRVDQRQVSEIIRWESRKGCR